MCWGGATLSGFCCQNLPTWYALFVCLTLSLRSPRCRGAGRLASARRLDSPRRGPSTEQALKEGGSHLPLFPHPSAGPSFPWGLSPPTWPRGLLPAHSLPSAGPAPSAHVLPDFRVPPLTPRHLPATALYAPPTRPLPTPGLQVPHGDPLGWAACTTACPPPRQALEPSLSSRLLVVKTILGS